MHKHHGHHGHHHSCTCRECESPPKAKHRAAAARAGAAASRNAPGPRVPCTCGDGSCMLCDDHGMVPVSSLPGRGRNPSARPSRRGAAGGRFEVRAQTEGRMELEGAFRSFDEARHYAEELASAGSEHTFVVDRELDSEDSVVWRSGGAEGHHRFEARRRNPVVGKLGRYPEGVMTEAEWVQRYAESVEEYWVAWESLYSRKKYNAMDGRAQEAYEKRLKADAARPRYRAWKEGAPDVFMPISQATDEASQKPRRSPARRQNPLGRSAPSEALRDRVAMEAYGVRYRDLPDDGAEQDYVMGMAESVVRAEGQLENERYDNPVLVSPGCRCERGGTCDVSHDPSTCPCEQCVAGERRVRALEAVRALQQRLGTPSTPRNAREWSEWEDSAAARDMAENAYTNTSRGEVERFRELRSGRPTPSKKKAKKKTKKTVGTKKKAVGTKKKTKKTVGTKKKAVGTKKSAKKGAGSLVHPALRPLAKKVLGKACYEPSCFPSGAPRELGPHRKARG